MSSIPVKSGPKPGQNWEIPAASGPPRPENPFNKPGWGLITVSFMESFLKFRLVAATEVILARSSAKASQKALCVMKLSFLFKLKEIPISEYNPNLLLPNHSMALNLKENPWKLLRGHLFLMRRNKDSNSKEEKKRGKKKDLILFYLEKSVPQSHLYSLVPQVFEWAFQSDWTAYFLEHFSHFHFFSPCFLLKCFFIPVRSPRALEGSWWTQVFSGQM